MFGKAIEKVKGFCEDHEEEIVVTGLYAASVAIFGMGIWLGNAYAMSKFEFGLTRGFDVNPTFEDVYASTLKQITEIDKQRNARFK